MENSVDNSTTGNLSIDGFQPPPTRNVDKGLLSGGQHERPSTTPTNKRALSRHELTYKLETFKKNALIIFNQTDDANWKPGFEKHKEVEDITSSFEQYNFEVKNNVYYNKTSVEILAKIKTFTAKNYTDYGCVGVVILSHGTDYGRLKAAKGTFFSDQEIITELKARNKNTLVTKPKFLLILTCGSDHNEGPGNLQTDEQEPYHLPEEADLLILHSCYIGTPCVRRDLEVSWFIQTFCAKIDRMAAEHDLVSIMTEVKRMVSVHKKTRSDVFICRMPTISSTLTRKLYLRKFGDPSPSLDPSLISPYTGEEEVGEDDTPGNSMDDRGPAPTYIHLLGPYPLFTIFSIYMLLWLFCSGTVQIEINMYSSSL